MKRILINKMSSLGDIIHVFPVLHYLKHYEPDCQIDWVVEKPFAELVKAHPFVNQVITVQTKKWRSELWSRSTWKELGEFRKALCANQYDILLDLQGNVKSGVVTAMAKSKVKVGFEYASVPEWPNILVTNKRFSPPTGNNIREDYLFLVQSAMKLPVMQNIQNAHVQLLLSEEEGKRLDNLWDGVQRHQGTKVLVCSGSNWPNKQLSKETLQQFLECLSEKYHPYFIFAWGNLEEKQLAEELAKNFSGHSLVIDRLSLPTLQNLMSRVDLVLAMDSLPLHLAGTTSTPSFSVFGPSSAKKYKPLGEAHCSFQGTCPYAKTFEKRCAILRTCQTGACMKGLQGEAVFAQFYSWWVNLEK